jgi:hypothetical protein
MPAKNAGRVNTNGGVLTLEAPGIGVEMNEAFR